MIERFRSSPQTEKIDEALAKAQAKIQPASKDAVNPHFKSRFASLNSIFDAVREPFAESGIAVLQAASSEGELVTVTTRLSHAGQFYEADLSVKPTQPGPQGLGSVVSYLRRYGLASLAGVPVGDDDDAEAAEGHEAPKANGKASADAAAKVRAAAAKPINAKAIPKDSRARQADLLERAQALGLRGPQIYEKLGEWIGKPIAEKTFYTADDWTMADTALSRLENVSAAGAILGQP